MSVVGAALILGVVVVLLIRLKVVRVSAAIVCILFGLVLGVTQIGGAVNRALAATGQWVAAQIGNL